MRGANLTSPSVAYRNLKKLVDLDLAFQDEYGMYNLKDKVSLKGYVWFGKSLFPRLLFFGFFFVGLLSIELAVLIVRLLANSGIEASFILLMVVTAFSMYLFLFEGFESKHKLKESS